MPGRAYAVVLGHGVVARIVQVVGPLVDVVGPRLGPFPIFDVRFSIKEKPDTASIPDDPGARAVLTFGLLEHVEKDTLTNILKYLRRMEEEWQVVFCVALARHENKKTIAFSNREFALWAAENEDLL